MHLLKRTYPYIIILVVTLLIGFPLLSLKMLDGDDAVFHLFRICTIDAAIKDGQLIPMINPYMMNGLGYAYNMFYGIVPPYIINIINLVFHNIGFSVNLFVLLTLFLSGLFMYKMMYYICQNKYVSLLSSLIYMAFPYHLYDIYERMALGEVASFVYIPLLFYGLYNIINDDGGKWYLLVIGASLLLTTHNLSAFMSAIFAFLYSLLHFKKLKKKDVLKKLLLSFVFIILLSLVNLLPLMEVSKSDYMIFDSVYMRTNSINMMKRAINLFDNTILSNIVKYSFLLVIIMFICYVFIKKKHPDLSFYLLAVLSLILTLNIIPWNYLPSIFSSVQFPWRYLSFFCFFLALSLPLLLNHLLTFNLKKLLIFILPVVFIAVPFINMGLSNKGVDNNLVNYNNIKKRNDIARSNGTASAEYLTRNAIYNYDYLKDYTHPHILSTNEVITANKKGTHLSFHITLSKDDIIELPFLYYPGYIVKANKQKISTFETENGLLGIKLEKGSYDIQTYYRGSNIMLISYTVTLISFLIFVILMIRQHRKNKFVSSSR